MTTTSEIRAAKLLTQKNCQRIIPDTSRIEALLFPRAELSFISSLARDVSEDEAAIYLLLGEIEPGKLKVYVGKSRQIKGRLQRHIQTKSWWDNVIYFLDNSRDGFSADDIDYLEWLLVCKLRQANRIVLDNQNSPRANEPTVNYWERSRFEKIYNEIAALAKMLKFDIFDRIYDNDADAQIFFCKNNKGANAIAYFRDNNIFVQKNSECRLILTNSGENSSYLKVAVLFAWRRWLPWLNTPSSGSLPPVVRIKMMPKNLRILPGKSPKNLIAVFSESWSLPEVMAHTRNLWIFLSNPKPMTVAINAAFVLPVVRWERSTKPIPAKQIRQFVSVVCAVNTFAPSTPATLIRLSCKPPRK